MYEVTLFDSNFGHQNYLTPYIDSDLMIWKRDNIRRKINVYTDNFIKKSVIEIPKDGNKNICLLLEPLTNPAWTDIYDYIKTDFEKFDFIITHNLYSLEDLILSRPDKFIYTTKCITTSWLSKDKILKNYSKDKKISCLVSAKNFSEGHRIRHLIYEKYKHLNIIDFFGSGIPDFNGDFQEGLYRYEYSICCENTLQKGFNSEKLNDCFLTGCIPIYWGSEILDQNIDQSSVFYFNPKNIDRIDFSFDESLSNLERIIQNIIQRDPYKDLANSVSSNKRYTETSYQSENNLYNIFKQRNIL